MPSIVPEPCGTLIALLVTPLLSSPLGSASVSVLGSSMSGFGVSI